MDKEQLILELKEIPKKYNSNKSSYDGETAHIEADELLLRYINDKEITEAFNNIEKWYA